MRKPTIFISYSHRDADWQARVATHLSVLGEHLTYWNDLRIDAGTDWQVALDAAVDGASAAVLLVSAHFLGSRFIQEVELPRLLSRQARDRLPIIPLLLTQCDWEAAAWLRRLQLWPRDARALAEYSEAQIDAQLAQLAAHLRLAVGQLPKGTGTGREAPVIPPDVSIANLPTTGEHLFGRERELALLDQAWADPNTHVLTLVAWGGVGKSALVNHWLSRLASNGYRGAQRVFGWSFHSQGVRNTANSADEFLSTALRRLGAPELARGSAWERGERLTKLLKHERVLLVLDGLEPLQAPPGPDCGRIRDHVLAALVRELAFANPGLCVITSRAPITDLEQFRQTTAPVLALEGLSDVAGAELLRALRVRGTEEELQRATLELDGHSLALNLLGSYLRDIRDGDVSMRALPAVLDDAQDGSIHAKRLMASYERWFGEGPELAVLRLLGLFDRPADPAWVATLRASPAIAHLSEPLVGMGEPAWRRVLVRLRQANLLANTDPVQPDVLDVHPLVREYFGHQLRTRHPEAWREGHARLYEHFCRRIEANPRHNDDRALLLLALAHGCRAGRHEEVFEKLYLAGLLRGIPPRNMNLHSLDEAQENLSALIHFFEPPWAQLVPGLSEANKDVVRLETVSHLLYLGRGPESLEPLQEKLRDPSMLGAYEFSLLTQIHVVLGDLVQARHYAEQALRQFQSSEKQPWEVTMLAWTLLQSGQRAEARKLFLKAKAMVSELEREQFFICELIYCDLLMDEGRADELLEHGKRYLEWAHRTGIQQLLGLGRLAIGTAVLFQAREHPGALSQALDDIQQALVTMRRITPWLILYGLKGRAMAYRMQGDFQQARRDLDEAMFIAARGHLRLLQVDLRLEACRLALAMGSKDTARAELKIARTMIQRLGYHRRDVDAAELEQLCAS